MFVWCLLQVLITGLTTRSKLLSRTISNTAADSQSFQSRTSDSKLAAHSFEAQGDGAVHKDVDSAFAAF